MTKKQQSSWPVPDPQALTPDFIEIPVSVNGKFHSVVLVPHDCSRRHVERVVLGVVAKAIQGKTVTTVLIGDRRQFANVMVQEEK